MAQIDNLIIIFQNWVFWLCLGLSVLGLALILYLLYKEKNKIAYWLLSIPFTILATIVLNLLVLPLVLPEVSTFIQQISLSALVSAIGYPALLFFFQRVLIKVAAKLLGFNITKGG